MKRFIAIIVVALLLIGPAIACTTIVVGKNASQSGYVMVGHNEDDGGRVKVNHYFVPSSVLPTTGFVVSEEGRAKIAQPNESAGFYWVECKMATGGLSASDSFLNEYGVYITSNGCGSAKTSGDNDLKAGGVEYAMRLIVAQTARSATHAKDIIIHLVEEYGYASSARSYVVADAKEAWVIQIAEGRNCIAVRVPDDEIAVIPNCFTIRNINGYSEVDMSENLISKAIENGWATSAETFDFAKAYQSDNSWQTSGNVLRQSWAYYILTGESWQNRELPFSVKPQSKVSSQDMMELLRSHYDNTVYDKSYQRAHVPGLAPHDTEIRRICSGHTVESTICEFDEIPILTTLWTALGRPCEQLFIPFHPLVGLPADIDAGEAGQALKNHFSPDVDSVQWSNSLWQHMRDFQNTLELVYADSALEFKKLQLVWEEWAVNRNTAAITTYRSQANNVDRGLLCDDILESDALVLHSAVNMLDGFLDEMNIVESWHEPLDDVGTIRIVFDIGDTSIPFEPTIILGPGFFNTDYEYLDANFGSLTHQGGSLWSVDFDKDELLELVGYNGVFEFFVGGITASGESFVSMLFL